MNRAITNPIYSTASSLIEILRTPHYRRAVIVPWLIAAASSLPLFWLFWQLSAEFIPEPLSSSKTYLGGIIQNLLSTLLFWFFSILRLLGVSLLSGLLAFLTANILGGFYIERFIELALMDHSLKATDSYKQRGTVQILAYALWDNLRKLALLSLFGVLFIVLSFVPFGPLIAFLLGALLLGYEIFDTILVPLGSGFNSRLSEILKHFGVVFIVGLTFGAIFLLPLAALFFMPVGYLVAIKELSAWRGLTNA